MKISFDGIWNRYQRGTNYELYTKNTLDRKKSEILKKVALTLTFLCDKINNCTVLVNYGIMTILKCAF